MTTIMPTAGLCDTEPDRRQPPAPHTDQTETHSHTRTPDLNEVGAYLAAMATAAILALVHMVVIDLWGRTENAKLRDLLMKWDSAWLTGITPK